MKIDKATQKLLEQIPKDQEWREKKIADIERGVAFAEKLVEWNKRRA